MERQREALERFRFVNWTAAHPILRTDPPIWPPIWPPVWHRYNPRFNPWNLYITVCRASTSSFGKICEPSTITFYELTPDLIPELTPYLFPEIICINYSLWSVDEKLWKDLWTERQPILFYELTLQFNPDLTSI